MRTVIHCRKAIYILLLLLFCSFTSLNAQQTDDSSKAIIRDLYAETLTLLRNENNILPLKNLDKIKIASVAICKNETTIFQYRISKYAP